MNSRDGLFSVLFPVLPGNTPCDMTELQKTLSDPNELGAKPHVILSPMELGPELLFRSDDSVLAAPYHMNVEGNLDAAGFFTATNPDQAYAIAHRRNADLVVVCRAVLTFNQPSTNGVPTILQLLLQDAAPARLPPYPTNDMPNFLIFRVRP